MEENYPSRNKVLQNYFNIYIVKLFTILFFLTVPNKNFAQDCSVQKTISDPIICVGQVASIILYQSDPLLTYQLREGTTNIGTPVTGTGGDIVFNVSPAVSTTYNVIAVECSIQYDDLAIVTVNNQPNAGTDGSISICEKGSAVVNLFDLITGEDLGGTWTRTSGSGGIFNAASGTFQASSGTTTSTFTYTLSASFPCSFDSSVATINIVASPTPSVTITVNPSNDICEGTTVNFTANSTNGGSSPSYQWQINGTNVGSDSPFFSSNTLSNTDKVRVIITSNATCAFPTTANSNEITMTVNDNVTPLATISASTNSICPGTTIDFSSLVINGGSNPTYQWKVNGINVGINSPNFSTSTLTDGDVVSVELTSNAVCANPQSVTSNTINITVKPAIPVTPNTINGLTVICPETTNITYQIDEVTNATSYNWTLPSGWNITSGIGSNIISVSATSSAVSGNISVSAQNECGTSGVQNLAITVQPPIPNTPGPISGANTVCPNTSGLNYNVAVVPNASIYNWSVPNGWTITSGNNTNTITLTATNVATTGIISVSAQNNCGTSNLSSLSVVVNPDTPATPGPITGSGTVCPENSNINYTISSVPDATFYNWTLPSGWSITTGGGTNSISVSTSTTSISGNVTVSAGNNCGISGQSSLGVVVSPASPITPGVISGNTEVCPNTNNLVYNISPVQDATSYTWSLPSGWNIVTGLNSNSITVSTTNTANSGNISVYAENSCGTSSPSIISVTVNPAPPATPGQISGNISVCPDTLNLNYSINSVQDADSYNWTVPSGWIIVSGAGSSSITVNASSTAINGSITVFAENSCGLSGISTLPVTVRPAIPSTPGIISGLSTVCPNTSNISYSVNQVQNATTYNWILPSGWSLETGGGSNAIVVSTSGIASSGTIKVSAENNCGTSEESSINVTVNPAVPSTPGVISGGAEQCINLTGLTYSVSAVPNATSYIWNLPTGWTITSGGNTNSIIVATTGSALSGNITVYASNSCGNSGMQTFSVSVSTAIPSIPETPVPAPGQASSICPVATGLVYSISNVPNATSYQWNIPAGWTITSGNGTTSITVTAGVQSTGNKNISVTATNACGSSTSNNFVVTVGTFAYVDAGPDQIVCSGTTSVSMNATAGGATNINNDLTWSAPSGSFSNTRKYNATYFIDNNLSTNGGTVILTATVRAEGSCGTASDQMTLTVLPPITASISGSTTICFGESTTLTFNGTPNTKVTYTISGMGSSYSINLDNSGTAVLNTTSLFSTTIFTITGIEYLSGPSCYQAISSSATVTVNQNSTIQPGETIEICQSPNPSTVTLTGASIGGGATTGAWTISSGGGTLSSTSQTSNPHLVTYTPDANFSGTVTLTLTTNAQPGCIPISSTRTIKVNLASIVDSGGPDVVCQSSSPSTIILSGASIGGGATTGVWSINSGSGTLNTLAPTTDPGAVSFTPAANFSGIINLTLTSNSLTGCSSVSSTRQITVNQASISNAGGPDEICQSSNPSAITLTGANVSGGASAGAWSITSGGGILSSTTPSANPSVITYTPAVNYSGLVTLTLTSDALQGCLPVSSTRTIQVNSASIAYAGGPDTICQSASSSSISLNNATVSGGATLGAWSISSGGGTLSSTSYTSNPSLVTYTPTPNFAGTVTLTLTSNALNTCTPITSTRTITVNSAPVAFAGGPDVLCQSNNPSSVVLSGASFGGGASAGSWTITNGNGTLSSTAETTNPELVSFTPEPNFSGNVTLTLLTNSLVGCNPASSSRTITINQSSIVNAGNPDIICQSASPTALTLNGATLGGGATNGTWQITSGTGTLSNLSPTGTPEAVTFTPEPNFSGSVILTLTTNAQSGCPIQTDERLITINPESIIMPGGPDSLCQSSNPSPFILNGANIGGGATTGTWSIISGGGSLSSTSPTANPETVAYTPSPNYSGSVTLRLVTNAQPGCTTKEATRTLTVNKRVIITSQPSNVSVCASFPADMYVVAIGDGLTYQWYKGSYPTGIAITNSSNISGAQTSNLHFNQVNLSDDGSYYVIVKGISPCPDIISAVRTLNVDQAIIISSQPLSQSICSGSSVTFSVNADANGDQLSFQWRKNGVNIPGQTSSSMVLSNITAGDGGNYDVIISGPSGYTCSSAQSSIATLNVKPIPSVNANPNGETICSDTQTAISLSSSIPSTSFTWTVNQSNVVGASDNSGSSILQTLSAIGNQPGSVTYNITPTSNGCIGNVNPITITVNPATDMNQPVDLIVCNGNLVSSITFTTNNVGGTTSYAWTNPNPAIGLPTSGIGSTQTFTAVNTSLSPLTTNISVTPTFNNAGKSCVGESKTFSIVINPSGNVNQIPEQTFCNNSNTPIINFNSSNNGGITTYNWTNSNPTIGLGNSGSGNLPSFSAVNNGVEPISSNVTVIPTFSYGNVSCIGPSEIFSININPSGQINQPSDQIICNGGLSTLITFNSPSAGGTTTYSWTNPNPSIGLVGVGTETIPPFTAVNNTSTPISTVISVTPTFTNNNVSCVGQAKNLTLTIEPSSVPGNVTISPPNITPAETLQTLCHSASGTLYLSNHIGNIIRWEYSTNGGLNWTPIANTTATYNFTDLLVTTIFRAVVQNGPYCTEVVSATSMINVIPNVKPDPVTANPSTICNGESTTLISQSSYATSQIITSSGTFNQANPVGWLVDGGVFSAGADNGNPTTFLETNGNASTEYDTTSNDKFAIVRGNLNSTMETPIFNTLGLTNASLSFDHAYKLLGSAWAQVELSLDGGLTYTVVLATYGPGTQGPYNPFNTHMVIDLNSFIGQSNLRIRFRYFGSTGSSWAIDNVAITEPPIGELTTQWVDNNTGEIISTLNSTNLVVSPTVTTTYSVTSYINGCTSFGPEGTTYLTVTVNQRPESLIGIDQTICYDSSASFSVDFTGTGPWNLTYKEETISTGVNSFTTINNITTNPFLFTVNNITNDKIYTISNLNDSLCTSSLSDLLGSATVTVLTGKEGFWTGRESTDWFDCMNWEKGLPSSTIDAEIPTNPTGNNMPVIDPSNSPYAAAYNNIASARDLLVANGAQVSMSTSNQSDLHISRNWKNAGTFYSGIGTVTFNGSTLNQIQTINEGIKNEESFYNLTLDVSNGAKGVRIANGFELTVNNELSLLEGDLRLIGEAQLVQSGTDPNPSAGIGKLLIDQQGRKSSYHYNYWSSPVTVDGISYSINDVLKDGTDSQTNPFNPSAINFGNGAYFADGPLTFPIKISNSWIYKYTSISTAYAGWQFIGNSGTLNPAQGFTMKGPTGIAPFTVPQNYVFTGKPISGNIDLPISINQNYLVGNPYPSALDADEFIKDNIKDGEGRADTNVINGALYFWDHFGGQTHILGQYIGGYATYTLMGGVVAISNDPLINANGSTGTKIPKKYIPVAQGFFVGTVLDPQLTNNNPNLSSPISGGTIQFKNSQRAFQVKSADYSIFFRSISNNKYESPEADNRKKIRLLYESPSNLFRELLVGVAESSTNLFDIGYDAPLIDLNNDDMYWDLTGSKIVIQAVPNINSDRILPLGIITSIDGLNTIKIKELENIPENINLYIHDEVTGLDVDIRTQDFEIFLPAGNYINRFSLRFQTNSLGINENSVNSTLVYFNSNNQHTIIKTNPSRIVKKVYIFNLNGQKIIEHNNTLNENEILINCERLSKGVYIVKTTLNDNSTKNDKIIID